MKLKFLFVFFFCVIVYQLSVNTVEEALCYGRILLGGQILYQLELVALLAVGGFMTFLSYTMIPILITYIVKDRRDLTKEILATLYLVCLFILFCGVGHLIDVINIWKHNYYLAGIWHLITGLISVVTGIVLFQYRQELESIPRREDLVLEKLVSESIQEATASGFWWVDPDLQEVKWTVGMYSLYELPKDYTPKVEDLDAMVHPDDWEKFNTDRAIALENGRGWFTFRLITTKGTKYIKALVEGRVEGVKGSFICGTATDITESILEHQEAIIEVNGLKTELALAKSKLAIKDLRDGTNNH